MATWQRRSPRDTESSSLNEPGPRGRVLHRVRSLVAGKRACQVGLYLLLGLPPILVGELHADAGGAFALCALRRQPDDPARNRKLFVLAHEVQQHEHFVAEAIVAVGRDEEAAVFHERHVSEVQRALVLDGERQQARFVGASTAGSFVHALFPAEWAQRHNSDSTAMPLLIEVRESLRISRTASESSNRRHIFDGIPCPDKWVTSRIDVVSRMRSVTQLSRQASRTGRSLLLPRSAQRSATPGGWILP